MTSVLRGFRARCRRRATNDARHGSRSPCDRPGIFTFQSRLLSSTGTTFCAIASTSGSLADAAALKSAIWIPSARRCKRDAEWKAELGVNERCRRATQLQRITHALMEISDEYLNLLDVARLQLHALSLTRSWHECMYGRSRQPATPCTTSRRPRYSLPKPSTIFSRSYFPPK